MGFQKLIRSGSTALKTIRSIAPQNKEYESIQKDTIHIFMSQLELSKDLTTEEKYILLGICREILLQHSSDDFLAQMRELLQECDNSRRCNLMRQINQKPEYTIDHQDGFLALSAIVFASIYALIIAFAIPSVFITAVFIALNLCLVAPILCSGIRHGYQYFKDIKNTLVEKQQIKKMKHELATETVYFKLLKKLGSAVESTNTNMTNIDMLSSTSESVLKKSRTDSGIPSSTKPIDKSKIHFFSTFKTQQPDAAINPSSGETLAL